MTRDRLALFPLTTALQPAGEEQPLPGLAVAGHSLAELAEIYGTPLYLFDAATMETHLNSYRQALARHYPGPSAITYAGKAFLCLAMAQWVERQGLWLDCTGASELHIAAQAGLARSRTLVHGVNKSPADLQAALQHAAVIVVDNLTELERLAQLFRQAFPGHALPALWLRLRPGLAVDTHAYTQTGQSDSKFGLSPEEVLQAARFCQQHSLPLEGLHFHLGSQFHDPAPLAPALEVALRLLAACRAETGWQPAVLSPGGGWGAPYHEDDLPHPPIADYIAFIAQTLAEGCQKNGLPLPRLQLEPGRSLVAQAGVAVYRLGAVKHTSQRRWLLLDGGIADNPRPALYHTRYTALPVQDPLRPPTGPAWLAGPYCQSGDVLIEDLPLPDMQPGELLAVPVSGAYHLALGSNYNGALRPAVLWLDEGGAHLIQRRETAEDLMQRDQPLP